MANLTETSQWVNGIYQLEITDPVEGGAGGVSNLQAKQLGDRTKWLKDQIFPGELKWLNVDASFVSTNFPSGLGIGFYTGWKIASDMDGRIAVAYGGYFSTIGAIGGSKDAVVVSHSHTYSKAITGRKYAVQNDDTPLAIVQDAQTSTVGESGINKNMPPYKVVLCIEKL